MLRVSGRLPAAAGLAAAVLVALVLPEPGINDWPFFEASGDKMLAGRNPYEARLLVGPLALALYGLLGHQWVAAVLAAVLLPAALWRVAGRSWRCTAVTAAAAVPWCAAGAAGHLDDQVAAVLLVLAVTTTGLGSGLWLTLACAAKPFALFALPVVDRRAALVTTAAGAVGLAFFLLALDGGWLASEGTTVQSGSPLYYVLPHNEPLPRWWRLAELAVLLVVAALAARRVDPLRAVLVTAAVRVALEPGDFVYYAAALALLAACVAARDGQWWPLALTWVVMLGVAFPAPGLVRLAALAGIVALSLHGRQQGHRPYLRRVESAGRDLAVEQRDGPGVVAREHDRPGAR